MKTKVFGRGTCLMRRSHRSLNMFNPFTPKSDLILLCLTPDDFTRQRETPCEWKGKKLFSEARFKFVFFIKAAYWCFFTSNSAQVKKHV